MPVPTHRVGNKLILVGDLNSPQEKQGSTVIYARVSSSDQKSDSDRRVARVLTWATENEYKIDKVVTEVGSALNGRRSEFLTLLGDPSTTTILVEHRDRFCWFGSDDVEAALSAQSTRLYGSRSAANRAQKAIEVVCS
jgi:predicted site-specific integrase-resolvase